MYHSQILRQSEQAWTHKFNTYHPCNHCRLSLLLLYIVIYVIRNPYIIHCVIHSFIHSQSKNQSKNLFKDLVTHSSYRTNTKYQIPKHQVISHWKKSIETKIHLIPSRNLCNVQFITLH